MRTVIDTIKVWRWWSRSRMRRRRRRRKRRMRRREGGEGEGGCLVSSRINNSKVILGTMRGRSRSTSTAMSPNGRISLWCFGNFISPILSPLVYFGLLNSILFFYFILFLMIDVQEYRNQILIVYILGRKSSSRPRILRRPRARLASLQRAHGTVSLYFLLFSLLLSSSLFFLPLLFSLQRYYFLIAHRTGGAEKVEEGPAEVKDEKVYHSFFLLSLSPFSVLTY